MQKVTFNEKGEALDGTGNVVGVKDASGKVVLNKPAEQTPQPDQTIQGKKAPSEIVKKSISYTKYEVKPESEFTVRFCLGTKEDRVLVYMEDAYLKVQDLERHWVTFRMWKYEEELAWKNQCMEFDQQTRSFKLNTAKLDELKVRNLIKSWSFEEYDPKFKLLHVNRILSDESYDIFKGFFPTIVNNILFLMNRVLENNG